MRRALLVVAIGFCAIWSIASLWLPFGWDQGLMASVGDVILHGGMPYRDAWDIKGPGAHLWFAAAQWLFGRGQAGIRVLDLALLIGAAIVLARTGARLTRPSIGPWIGIGLVLCHSSLTFFYTAQPDGAVSLAFAVVFSPLLAQPRRRHILIASFVVGLATLVKPLYLVFLALPLLVAARQPDQHAGQRVRYIVAIVVAAAVPVLAALVWFIWRDAFDDLVEVLIRYNTLEYSGATQLAVRTRIRGYAEYLWSGPRAPALAFLMFGAVVLWHRSRSVGVLLVGWLLAGLALVGVQGRFYTYHWTIIVPPAVLLVAIAFDVLTRRSPALDERNRKALAVLGYTGVISILGPLTIQPALDINNWLRFVAGVDAPATYYGRFRDGPYSAADQIAAADYIRAHTQETDKVAVLGYDAPALYLSGRRNSTRFSYALPLVGYRSSEAARQRYRKEFLTALQDQPECILVGILLIGANRSIEVFPEFMEFLNRGYRLERSFGAVDVYRRIR